ncbi:hypothetical protein ACWG5P_31835 [Streptomyces prasinus]
MLELGYCSEDLEEHPPDRGGGADALGSTGPPYLTDFAESCKLRPPKPPRPKRRKGSRAPAKPPQKTWPVSPAHHALSWAMREPDLTQDCPTPLPPHTRRTIAAYKRGWPLPDYGQRSLRPPSY